MTALHEVRNEWSAAGITGVDLDAATSLLQAIDELSVQKAPKTAIDDLVAPFRDYDWFRKAYTDEEGRVSDIWSDGRWAWRGRNYAFSSVPAVAEYPGSVLWFLGEKDANLPLVPTYLALQKAFEKSPGEDQRLEVIPNAPHSFIQQYEDGTRRYMEGFWSTMDAWLAERGYSDPDCS